MSAGLLHADLFCRIGGALRGFCGLSGLVESVSGGLQSKTEQNDANERQYQRPSGILATRPRTIGGFELRSKIAVWRESLFHSACALRPSVLF